MTGSAPQRHRAGSRHPQVDQRVEQEPQTVRDRSSSALGRGRQHAL